ncbi:MAG: hypothetical protein NW224_17015 [Leptolyngbyaceae cyanobacterium bins.302]|nr:hypothetical protein [Leptolyngbyaceae cyanobacterium bins.302]
MDTTTEDTVLVVLEGQQHHIRRTIAENDELLRRLLSQIGPELAGAEIKRTNGVIEVVPKKGTKGNQPAITSEALSYLDTAASNIDPAITACLVIQQTELAEGFNPEQALRLDEYITHTISESQRWQASIQQTLYRLDNAASASKIPFGF